MIWLRPQLRVLFVCTANVCRSPLAEALLRHRLGALGLAGRVAVSSAGTCAGQRGRRPDPRVDKLAVAAGFSLGRIRSRMLTTRMIQRSDYVLVMERRHLDDIAHLIAAGDVAGDGFPGMLSSDKRLPVNVQLLGAFLPRGDEDVKDIPDPYFGDRQSFGDVYELIDSALTGFLDCIETRLGIFQDSQD